MKFAICNETFENWSREDALEFAAKAGYTGWEIAPFTLGEDPTGLSAVERSEYRTAVTSAGLEVVGLHWLLAKTSGLHLTSADAPTRKATSEYLCELARLCQDLGGSVLVLGSPKQRDRADGQSEAEAYMHAANVLRATVKTLQKTKVKIAIEPLGPEETNFVNTAADARRLIELVGSDSIGLHLDMKAMSTETQSPPEIIRENRDLLIHVHANDPNQLGPGMGEQEIGPSFEALGEIGYEGWVSVEVFDLSPGIDKIVTESLANMRSVLVS